MIPSWCRDSSGLAEALMVRVMIPTLYHDYSVWLVLEMVQSDYSVVVVMRMVMVMVMVLI